MFVLMGDGLRFLSELYFVFIFLFLAFCGKKNDTGLFGMSVSKQTKGIAAVLIMVGHSVSATTIDTIQFLNVGWYGVAVFFLWSGYGVAYGYNNKEDYLKGFLIKRGIKIGVPFLLAHLIYIPIKIACGMHYSSRDYILSLFGGEL